jgi:thymidylate synthase (FAD)
MTIEFVDQSTVKLVKHNAHDFDVAKAAWVSNFGQHASPVLPEDFKTLPYRIRDYANYNELAYFEEEDKVRIKRLINFLYRERHMSPFEHGSFTFYIECPIFVAREFMRHRTFSYNETSGRYKELEPRFYLIDSERPLTQVGTPGKYTFEAGTDEQYGITFAHTTSSYITAWHAYQKMLENGVAREVARNVLPVGIMTSFYATCNPRNLMQFLTLRNDKNALKEIRDVAVAMENIFATKMPLTYAAYKKYDWRDERTELEFLRAKVAQDEAYETYAENLRVPDLYPAIPRRRKKVSLR